MQFRYSKQYFFAVLLVLPLRANAQMNETIRADRPGQGVCAYAVGKYVLQTQTGIDAGGFYEEDARFSGINIMPNTVLRFGISDKIEINTAYEYRVDKYEDREVHYTTSGLSLGAIGSRINIYDGGKRGPGIGLQVTVKMPIQSADYRPEFLVPKVLLIANQQLSKRFSFLVNCGIDYNGDDAQVKGVYVANLGFAISQHWSTYVENYGDFNSMKLVSRWDGGFAYLPGNNLQFDLYGGAGYNNGVFDYFGSMGVSWRIVAGN